MNALIAGGLMPDDEVDRKAPEVSTYALRTEGLAAALPLYHFGRAIFNLNQRRGFKSNRKADRGNDDEKGKIATSVGRIRKAMAENGLRTLEEFLHKRRLSAEDQRRIPAVRTRLRPERGSEAKGDGYDFYAERALLEEEFGALWSMAARRRSMVSMRLACSRGAPRSVRRGSARALSQSDGL